MKMDIQGTESAVLGAAHELLATGYQLLFDDPSPLMQPDGILVAARAPI